MSSRSSLNLSKPLLEVTDLAVHYPISSANPFVKTRFLKAVDQVSFELKRGEVLGLVGESGCGKSTLARALLSLIQPTAGSISFKGENLVHLSSQALRESRKSLQMIFQDPLSSLNPRMTVGTIVAEPLQVFCSELGRIKIRQRVCSILERVGLSPGHINRYPHQFSGGQCQRIGIARALILQPDLVICDEPVSALDVSIQAQIINLLAELRREMGLSLFFISHDLGIVKQISDRVMVMYLGKIVETNNTDALYRAPKHPYTQALIRAILVPDPKTSGNLSHHLLRGELPSTLNPPTGCLFNPRCPIAVPECRKQEPVLKISAEGGRVACHLS